MVFEYFDWYALADSSFGAVKILNYLPNGVT